MEVFEMSWRNKMNSILKKSYSFILLYIFLDDFSEMH
jgi:hypothetical protein